MAVLGVIPARLGSIRLPRKPLQLLGGEPLVVRVAEHVDGLGILDQLVVATDAGEVREVVQDAGFRAVLTSPAHVSGTDRVAEVAELAAYRHYDVIVNLQGDEPFLPREALSGALEMLGRSYDVGTAAALLADSEFGNPARVKVVFTEGGRALYFSRAPVPHRRDDGTGSVFPWLHLGLYAYTRPALRRWVAAPPSALERTEALEQLRALELGLRVGVARLAQSAPPGIDTAEDLRRAEAFWHVTHEVAS